jgi:hypothetical protein
MSTGRWMGMTLTACGLIAATFAAGHLNLVSSLADPGALVELDLLRAKGRPFESLVLAKYVHQRPSDFPESKQVWVIYKKTCPSCHELFKENWSEPTSERVIAIEVPNLETVPVVPDPVTGQVAAGQVVCPSCVFTSLPAGREWKIRTPLVVNIENGQVVEVSRVHGS